MAMDMMLAGESDALMASVTPEDGEALFNDMLENQRKYLPAKWFE